MANVQLQLSFLQPQPSKADIAPVWTTLDNQQRAELVAMLARLIAKLASANRTDCTADPADKENTRFWLWASFARRGWLPAGLHRKVSVLQLSYTTSSFPRLRLAHQIT